MATVGGKIGSRKPGGLMQLTRLFVLSTLWFLAIAVGCKSSPKPAGLEGFGGDDEGGYGQGSGSGKHGSSGSKGTSSASGKASSTGSLTGSSHGAGAGGPSSGPTSGAGASGAGDSGAGGSGGGDSGAGASGPGGSGGGNSGAGASGPSGSGGGDSGAGASGPSGNAGATTGSGGGACPVPPGSFQCQTACNHFFEYCGGDCADCQYPTIDACVAECEYDVGATSSTQYETFIDVWGCYQVSGSCGTFSMCLLKANCSQYVN
jgi:hypothetical protein